MDQRASGAKAVLRQAIHEAAAELCAHRGRPCLLFVSRQVAHSDLFDLWEALGSREPEALDVIVASPGGDIEAAYLVARELRRRAKQLTIYVPFRTKSAAALIALAADELVLGTLGELGPWMPSTTRSRRRISRSTPPGSSWTRPSGNSRTTPSAATTRPSPGS
jgi:hypothetical protein